MGVGGVGEYGLCWIVWVGGLNVTSCVDEEMCGDVDMSRCQNENSSIWSVPMDMPRAGRCAGRLNGWGISRC